MFGTEANDVYGTRMNCVTILVQMRNNNESSNNHHKKANKIMRGRRKEGAGGKRSARAL